MKASFKNWLFEGLNVKKASNKYLTCERVSDDEEKIIVKVAPEQVVKTKYGYAVILDYSHVVFVKDWAVNDNWYGVEVMLTKKYFAVKEWGEHPAYSVDLENCKWETWLKVAKEQQVIDEDGSKINPVRWEA